MGRPANFVAASSALGRPCDSPIFPLILLTVDNPLTIVQQN